MVFDTILHFFPVPHFLYTPVTGISLSDTHVRAIRFFEVRDSSQNLVIDAYMELPLPEGAITSGRINNQEQVIEVLKMLKQKMNLSVINACLPEEKGYLFELDIPSVEPKETRSAIEFRLEENVPLPADQVTFDYEVTDVNPQKNQIHAVVLALPAKFVAIYVDMFTAAGLTPHRFGIESQAAARALLSSRDTGGYIIIQFAGKKMSLSIISKRLVRFTSTLVIDHSSAGEEVKKVLAYWQGKQGTLDYTLIEKIIICGSGFDQTSASEINGATGMITEFGNVWVNAFDIHKDVPDISFMNSLAYASAIGLALPSGFLV